jgi:hypothetical protein
VSYESKKIQQKEKKNQVQEEMEKEEEVIIERFVGKKRICS